MADRIPPELIHGILEQGYYTPAGSPDYGFLAHCSLVCVSWSVPAQSLLFRKTTPLRSRSIALFHAALKLSVARGKFIGNAVRFLDIAVGRSSLHERCKPEIIIQVLQACPKVYELSLNTLYLHEFNQFELAPLKDVGQNIRALHLEHCGVQSRVLFQLLGIWPRIQFLKIGAEIAAWPWRHSSKTPVLRQGSSNNLAGLPSAHVLLYDLALSRMPQPPVLHWLLGSSAPSLRILDLREDPGSAAREILAVHAPHLRSLRLLHLSLDSAAFLRQCTHLEEFIIYSIPVVIPLASCLTSSIEHLSFRNPKHLHRDTLHPILDAIDVLPKLRMITCDKSSEGLREFATLKAKCTERGVEVAISEVPFWVYEDPVVVRRFPRRRSVSNFELMTS